MEMNLPLDQLIARLKRDPRIRTAVQGGLPNETVGTTTLAKAIATYERTVVSGRAPFDAWIDGDDNAISPSAKRGFALFNGKGDCAACHRGWNFTDDSFHDIGLRTDDIGRGKFVTNVPKMKHAFKTPNLREIARRGPYMHNGSVPTLEAVVAHYNDGGVARPSRAERIKPLSLTRDEQQDLVAFMQTLTSNLDPTTVPVLPR